MNFKYEPASEPLHISVKVGFGPYLVAVLDSVRIKWPYSIQSVSSSSPVGFGAYPTQLVAPFSHEEMRLYRNKTMVGCWCRFAIPKPTSPSPEPCTLNPQPCTLNPESWTLHPLVFSGGAAAVPARDQPRQLRLNRLVTTPVVVLDSVRI